MSATRPREKPRSRDSEWILTRRCSMPAAARVGDFTAHANTPLTPMVPLVMGSPNVFIGGLPAWRAGTDVHVCPLSNGPAPHVGGSVLKGSLTVYINKLQ